MRGKFLKNSKKGLTLPVAIAISTVLVIVAAGLIFIALSSVSTTTVTVNGRQAFMNVKSALEYAESYYSKMVTEYDKIGVEYTTPEEGEDIPTGARVEYLVAYEKENPVTKKSEVYYKRVNTLPDDARTYVQAKYLPVDDNAPDLKLTAYSFYYDNFGSNGKMASLTVTFTVGAAGSQNRVTVISIPKSTSIPGASDTIRLNLKQPVDLNWDICYYIWTYKDTAGAYTSRTDALKNASYVYTKSGSTYVRVNPDSDKLNHSESQKSDGGFSYNIEEPNGVWTPNNPDGTKGANGIMIKQANGWYAGDYKINKNLVNYFNVIFTNKGKLLLDNGGYDTQTCEIFHLWYLNADDKNIYFEFLNKEKNDGNRSYYTKYWADDPSITPQTGGDWDGMKYLDDTMLIYLKNQKTTVHFRIDKKENQAMVSNDPSATVKIESITSSKDDFSGPTFLKNTGVNVECNQPKETSNITMSYEGCGWWVANIDTNKVCDITVICAGTRYQFTNVRPHTISSSPDATSEAWLIVKKSEDEASIVEDSNHYDIKSEKEAHQTEQTALNSLRRRYDASGNAYYADYDGTSYVTVHAKAYNPDKSASPKLQYMNVLEKSSVGRQNLYEKLIEAGMLSEDDYDSTGFAKLSEVLEKATKAYNEEGEFIQKPVKYDATKSYEDATREDNSTLGATEKIKKADEAYQTYINALNDAITALVPAKVDEETRNAFNTALNNAKAIETNFKNYDAGYYATFTSTNQPYYTAKLLAERMKNATPMKAEVQRITSNLNDAVDVMNLHQVDRQGLQNIINAARAYADSTKYEKSYVDTLVNAINSAERYLTMDSIVQTGDPSIEAHKTSVQNAANEASVHPKQVEQSSQVSETSQESQTSQTSEVSQTSEEPQPVNRESLSAKLTEVANMDTTKDCTDASKQILENAKNAATQVYGNGSATQQEIDNALQDLEDAVKKFNVYKPRNNLLKEQYNPDGSSVRIWITPQTDWHYSIKVFDENGVEQTTYYDGTNSSFTHEADLDYIDIAKSLGATFEVYAEKQGDASSENPAMQPKSFSSGKLSFDSLTNDNAIFVIENESSLAKYDLVTLFISEKDVLQKDVVHIAVSISGKARQLGYQEETHYRYVRYAFKKPNETVTITSGSHGATGCSVAKAGEYVARCTLTSTGGGTYEVISVEDIYPKADNGNTGGQGSGGTPSGVVYTEDDYELTTVAAYSATADWWKDSIETLAINDNQMCIIFDPQSNGMSGYTNSDDGSVGPFIYCWWGEGGSGKELTSYQNKLQMQRKVWNGHEFCYIICPNYVEKCIITYHQSNMAYDNTGVYYEKYDERDKVTGANNSTTGVNNDVVLATYTEGSETKHYKYNIIYVTNGAHNGPTSQINLKESDIPAKGEGNVTENSDSEINWNEAITMDVPYGHVCLILDTHDINDVDQFSDKIPYAHIWSKDGGTIKNLTSWNNLAPLLKLDSGNNRYYYKIFENSYDMFIITNSANGDDGQKVIRDSTLPKDTTTNKLYKYYVIKPNGSGGAVVTHKSNTAANVTKTSPAVVNMQSGELNMAYVGGGKIRIKNKSYSETYGDDKMQNSDKSRNIYSGHKFGGSTRGGSDHRSGDAKLLPYYDWYEYKIPVEQSNVYTFEITGLDIDKSGTKTEQIQEVYGDVWVSLFNEDTETRNNAAGVSETVFSRIELSTFDPDMTQIASRLSVYIRKPADTTDSSGTHTWSNPTITKVSGTDGIVTSVGLSALGRQPNIFKSVEISKNNPFIEISITETITKAGSADRVIPHTYKTKLQGGDYILFNPAKNSNYGGWEKFKSDNDELIDACDNLLNMYYAKYIINQYNANGEIVNQSDQNNTQTKSSYLYGIIESKPYFSRANAGDPWKTSAAQISSLSDTEAYHACFDAGGIKDIVDTFGKLYEKMSLARSYIEIPLDSTNSDYHPNSNSSSRYPEYLNRGSTKKYQGVDSLKNKLRQAENTYITGDSVDKAKEAIEALDRAIANVSVSSEGSIAVVLYDAQNKVSKGNTFDVHYTEDEAGNIEKVRPMDDYNPEGYPIVFITPDAAGTTYEAIYNVQIYERSTNTPISVAKDKNRPTELTPITQKKMNKDEAWVLLDYTSNPRWRENSNTDYRVVTNDRYVKGTDSDISMKMVAEPKVVGSTEAKTESFNGETKPVYKTMTVYFDYDTEVVISATNKYTVRAGAYTFTNKETKDSTSPVYYKEYSDPVSGGGTTTVKASRLNLFTDEAKKYFEGIDEATKSAAKARYGMYTDNGSGGAANDASTLGWVTGSGEFATGKKVTISGNVNIDMPVNSKASFTRLPVTSFYSYTSDKGISFRWSSQDSLRLTANVEMYASEFRFASVGKIDGSSYISKHFYLYNCDAGKNDIYVRFYTDVNVAYMDNTGYVHNFVIREGAYRIEKKDKSTDYIADFFDEDYWKNLVYVHPLDMNGKEITGGAGLTSPRYSN